MNESRMACVVCGCTQERGCPGGCGWVSLRVLTELNCDGPLCTICAEMVRNLARYGDDVHRFRLAPLMRAVKAAGIWSAADARAFVQRAKRTAS